MGWRKSSWIPSTPGTTALIPRERRGCPVGASSSRGVSVPRNAAAHEVTEGAPHPWDSCRRKRRPSRDPAARRPISDGYRAAKSCTRRARSSWPILGVETPLGRAELTDECRGVVASLRRW
jgi:hypothetical protein